MTQVGVQSTYQSDRLVTAGAAQSDPGAGDYLMVVQAPCYRVSEGRFATESAFCEHLRLLRRRLGSRFDALRIAAPSYTAEQYESNKDHWSHIDAEEGIHYIPLHEISVGRVAFWTRKALPLWRTIREAVDHSAIVHTGMSEDVWRPTSLMANVAGVLKRRKVLFFVDIDFRRMSWMFYKTGKWSLKSYLVNRLFHDPLKLAQLHLAPKFCSLVMLKSPRMVRDVGRGAPHVRDFFDAAHSAEHIIGADELTAKLTRARDEDRALQVVYFGRFVEYKGLDRAIQALVSARRDSGRAIQLHLIGDGEQKARLQQLCKELDAGDGVVFHEPVRYGPELFELVRRFDAMLAAPLTEDTPRAAFDSMASGLPIVAFDIAYYQDLAEASGAVVTSAWPEVKPLAATLVELDRNREELVKMARAGVQFARDNTQDIWLDRRIGWTMELLEGKRRSPQPRSAGRQGA